MPENPSSAPPFNLSKDDQSIVDGILAGGRVQEASIQSLYERYFHLTYDSKGKYYQLDADELITAYNNAIISLRRAIVEKRFRGQSSLWTYLNSIFRNCCIDIIRRNTSKHLESVEEMPEVADSQQNIFYQLGLKQEFDRALNLLERLGDVCKQIIIDSEYWGFNSEEIAERIGFSNSRSVNSKKYTCLRRLKDLLEKAKGEVKG